MPTKLTTLVGLQSMEGFQLTEVYKIQAVTSLVLVEFLLMEVYQETVVYQLMAKKINLGLIEISQTMSRLMTIGL